MKSVWNVQRYYYYSFRAAMKYDFMNVEYKKILVWAK